MQPNTLCANQDRTILYVEDEETDVLLMELAFDRVGLASSLRVVAEGREAIRYLSGHARYADRQQYPIPRLILLDLNLPIVSGFEVLDWLRNNPELRHIPAIVFTSSTRQEDKARAKHLGANDYIEKPSTVLGFDQVVEQLKGTWF